LLPLSNVEGGKAMGVSVCPVANVQAPVESVWELLSEPKLFDEWWDAHTERIVPEGKASPGQTLYGTTHGLGKKWDVVLKIEGVNPEKHRLQFDATLPLGVANHGTITGTPIDPTSCRVTFG